MAATKNPKGLKSDKEWRDAVRKAVHDLRDSDEDGKAKKIKALDVLARKLVDKGLAGDVTALKEIGDRLDGKPAQALAVTGNLVLTHEQALKELDG